MLTDPVVTCIACGQSIHVGQHVIYVRAASLTEDGRFVDATEAPIEACGTCSPACLRMMPTMLGFSPNG